MRRPAALGVVVSLFLVGVVVGVLGANLYAHRHATRSGMGPGSGGTGARGEAAELQRRLALTSDQRSQVDAILDDSRRQAQGLWTDFRPRLVAIVEGANDRIEKVLTAAQKPEFVTIRAERREHMRRGLHGRGVPHLHDPAVTPQPH